MKKLLLFCISLAPIIFAQTDCNKLIALTKDTTNGITMLAAREGFHITNGKNGFILDVMKMDEKSHFMKKGEYVIGLLIKMEADSICMNKGSNIVFIFSDSSRLTLTNETGYNCKGWASVSFRKLKGFDNKESQLSQLLTKEIELIRVYTKDNFVEARFGKQKSEKLRQILYCLLNG